MRMRIWVSLLLVLLWGVPAEARPAPSAGQTAAESSASVQQLFKSAASLIEQSRYQEAAALLRKAEGTAPNQASIHHYLAYALWKQDRWTSARTEFQKAHQLDPQNPYTLYFLARIAQSTAHPDEAIDDYEAILRLGPAIEDTDQRLGQLYFDRGQIEKAREHIEAALKETPWESSLYYQLGKIDQKSGRAANAREEFASAERLKHVSQEAAQRLFALDQAVRDHETGSIGRLRAEILTEAADDPEILQSAGVLLGRAGLYDEALAPLESCVKLDPNSFEAQYNLGLTLLRLDRKDEAAASLEAALKLQPQSLEANRALAVLDVDESRNADAIERLRAANQVSPGDARILALLGEQYLQGHFVPDAIAALEEAVKLAPQNLNARFLLVEAYDTSHEYDRGLKAAEDALGAFPDSARATFEVAQELAGAGRYDDARTYAAKAVEQDAQMAEGWDLLGDLESKRGQYGAAWKAFERARSLDPSNLAAIRGATENLIRLKRYDEALAELDLALKAHPQDAGLYFNLMQLYARIGKREEASRAAATYRELHASEAARRDSERPRRYVPPGPTSPGA